MPLKLDVIELLQPLAEARDLFSDTSCRSCGSRHLTWHARAQNRGGVQDGRISMHEVRVIFVLGCDECSETLRIGDGDAVAAAMTAIQKSE